MVKATGAIRTLLLLTAVIPLLFLLGAVAGAQSDYPVPSGDPATWGIPGRTEELPPEQQTPPSNMFSAPQPPGNEALSQPSVPAGVAEEKYTGTREFGGMAGTGIDQYGPQQNR